MKICILIPVYNESRTIGSLVQKLREKRLDVLVIDDGSNDNSALLAQSQGAKVIRHEKNKGKGESLKEGFAYALEKGYEGVLTMDGDGQHDVADIKNFLDEVKKNPVSVITGNRMTDPYGMPKVRYLTNRFMSRLISLACGQNVPDTQCGYKYIGCEVLKNIHLTSGDFEIETEILMKASKKKYKIVSVPIQTIYRDEESKINPFKDTLRFIVYFVRELCSP